MAFNDEKWLATRMSDKQVAVMRDCKNGLALRKIERCNMITVRSLLAKDKLRYDEGSNMFYLSDIGEHDLTNMTQRHASDLFVMHHSEQRSARVADILIGGFQTAQQKTLKKKAAK